MELCKNETKEFFYKRTQREEVEEAKWVVDFWIHRRVAQLTGRFITR